MLWRMPVDTLKQRIDAMHTAQLSLDAPPPATRVSATNVFHRAKRTALTALTALTPAMRRPSGTRDWHSGSGNCGNPCRHPSDGRKVGKMVGTKRLLCQNPRSHCTFRGELADGVGFEPTVRLHARRFSRPVP